MLKFKNLTLENFGPYKGKQTANLADDGVTVIWGVNGRGKTQFLKAIYFAFYDSYTDNEGNEKDSLSILNSEAYDEGHYEFRVILEMEYDDKDYVVTRQRTLKPSVEIPSKDTDFTKYCFISIDGDIMSQESSERILRSIMPREIARFFLFDGELLEEYEKLLSKDSRVNTEIKDAIEDILGLPVLTYGRNDTQTVLEEYANEHVRLAQQDGKTRKIAETINGLKAQKAQDKEDLEKYNGQLASSIAERKHLEREMSNNDDARILLEKINDLEKDIASGEAKKAEIIKEISGRTGSAWTSLAADMAKIALNGFAEQLEELETKANDHAVSQRFIEEMQIAVKEHHCAVCGQDVDKPQADAILKRLSAYESKTGGLTPEENETFKMLRNRKEDLDDVISSDSFSKAAMQVLEKNLSDQEVEIADMRRELSQTQASLEEYGNREDLDKKNREMHEDLAKCMKDIDILNEGIDTIKTAIAKIDVDIEKQEKKLRQQSTGGSLEAADRKEDLCRQLYDIFEQGINAYREKLRADVENDATEFFVNISREEDFVALKMNDNYGLSIVHRDGRIVESRSSGYEHVVAMCLIGALHKNAPLDGPIVMDSPLGRLDEKHHDNIVKALPLMADQVVLLVQDRELNDQEARHLLNGNLKKEYILKRCSSRNTQIETTGREG